MANTFFISNDYDNKQLYDFSVLDDLKDTLSLREYEDYFSPLIINPEYKEILQSTTDEPENKKKGWFSGVDFSVLDNKDIPKLTSYNNYESLEDLIKRKNLPIKITSGFRGKGSLRDGKTKSGKQSNHNKLDEKGNPMAYDIVPLDGNFDTLRNILYKDPEVIQWFKNRNWGVIEEVTPDVMKKTGATGKHFHIGADTWAVNEYNKRIPKALFGQKLTTLDNNQTAFLKIINNIEYLKARKREQQNNNNPINFTVKNLFNTQIKDKDLVIKYLDSWEGSKHKAKYVTGDRGGLTKRGITLNTYKAYGTDLNGDGKKDVKDLNLMDNKEHERIVTNQFWNKIRGDEINDIYVKTALVDSVFMSGYKGIKIARESLGLPSGTKVDDQMINIINNNPQEAFEKIKQGRKNFYKSIANNDPSLKKFLNGWLRRVDSINYNYSILGSKNEQIL